MDDHPYHKKTILFAEATDEGIQVDRWVLVVPGSSLKQGRQEWDAWNKKMGGKSPWDFQRHPEIPILANHHGFRFPWFLFPSCCEFEGWFGAHPGYIKSPTMIREWGKAGTERFFQVSIITSWWMFFSDKKMMFSTSSNFTIPAQVTLYIWFKFNSFLFFPTQCLVYLPTKLCNWRVIYK